MPGEVMISANPNQRVGFRRHSFSKLQIQTNLLANSLTNRMKTNNAGQSAITNGGQNNLLHIANLNKEKNTTISIPGGRRLTSRAREVRNNRIEERMTRHREWELLNHTDIHTGNTFPETETYSVKSDSLNSCTSTQSAPVQRLTFGEYNDHIGVEKRGGIFKPIDMFAPSRYQHNVQESQFKVPIIEYENITLPHTGCLSTTESKKKRKSNLKVTFSTSNSVIGSSANSQRGEESASLISPKSKTSFPKLSYLPERDRIPAVGVAWDISSSSSLPSKASLPGHISHNLHPVTSGLNKEGTSESKTRWRVQSSRFFNRPFVPLAKYNIHR